MVTDSQVRLLMKLIKEESSLKVAAAKAGMDEKTARKYRDLAELPSQIKTAHTWRTRADPFSEVWEQVEAHLEVNPGLEAKTIFEEFQRPGTVPRRATADSATAGEGVASREGAFEGGVLRTAS